ncbi:hypothetical protein Tco_0403272 [Tanacetum coccineum]
MLFDQQLQTLRELAKTQQGNITTRHDFTNKSTNKELSGTISLSMTNNPTLHSENYNHQITVPLKDNTSYAQDDGSLILNTFINQLIDEEVSVLINGENFIVHVRELSNWSVKIEDDLDSNDGIRDNEQVESHSEYEASTKHETKNSNVMDEPDDVTDSEKEINETKEEEIPQKQNHFDCNSTPSDDSCPPGFEFLKGQSTLKPHGSESHKTSHCSTSFAKYREKDFKGTSLLHEINHVIEFGGSDFGLEIFASNTTLIFSVGGGGDRGRVEGVEERKGRGMRGGGKIGGGGTGRCGGEEEAGGSGPLVGGGGARCGNRRKRGMDEVGEVGQWAEAGWLRGTRMIGRGIRGMEGMGVQRTYIIRGGWRGWV